MTYAEFGVALRVQLVRPGRVTYDCGHDHDGDTVSRTDGAYWITPCRQRIHYHHLETFARPYIAEPVPAALSSVRLDETWPDVVVIAARQRRAPTFFGFCAACGGFRAHRLGCPNPRRSA